MSGAIDHHDSELSLGDSALDALENELEERWQRLLRWLEGNGMDTSKLAVKPAFLPNSGRGLASSVDIEASSRIINIPWAALMNSRTLQPLYLNLPIEGFKNAHQRQASEEIGPLNGTQLLTVHLALHRTEHARCSSDPTFGPYIDTLPQEFDNHPLTWVVNLREGTINAQGTRLLQCLPPSVLSLMNKVADRFETDKKIIYWYKERYESYLQPSGNLNVGHLLWAWLTVNTRCLYLRLFDEQLPLSNLTLGPLIDFANHPLSDDASLLQPPKESGKLRKNSVYTFRSPPHTVAAGTELFLKYGDHSNATLFTEYGFVDKRNASDGEVDVSDILHEVMNELGERQQLKQFLDDNCCSDMRLYGTPKPAYPSWSLMVALRIICDINQCRSSPSRLGDDYSERWLQVLSGLYTTECESGAREKLAWVCKTVITRAQERNAVLRRDLDDRREEGRSCYAPWFGWSLQCIQKLWEEEEAVAIAVMRSIENGVEF